jgi:hypothetical protein
LSENDPKITGKEAGRTRTSRAACMTFFRVQASRLTQSIRRRSRLPFVLANLQAKQTSLVKPISGDADNEGDADIAPRAPQ